MKRFNKDKYLKNLKIKRWLQSNSRYLYIGVSCLFVCIIGLYFAYSKFFVSKEEVVIKTTVGNFTQGDVIIRAYIDNEYSNTIPGKNDGYAVEKVVCDNGSVGNWDNDKWGLLTTNLTKRTKCNVYFKKGIKIGNIVAPVDELGKCPTVNEDGSVNVTAVEATNGYLCKAKDAYGDSYYYRGNVTNNYVKFGKWSKDTPDVVRGFYSATSTSYNEYSTVKECQSASLYNVNCTVISKANKDMYWRIVRINGDGTVRVIYDGTSAHANGESSVDRLIGESQFNKYYGDNAYVGYMYGQSSASTYADAHANTNNSTIKTYIDNWYKTNIVGTTNEQYLADNVFCNDRSISSNTPSGFNNLGYGMKNATAYRWYYGPWSSGSYNSSMRLICPQKNDAFTVSDTTNGNGALTYPVGLLSTDEIVLAGGWNVANSGYYLYSGLETAWWASPSHTNGSFSFVYVVTFEGKVKSGYSNNNYGVRPVLNLKADVLAQGTGAASDPYRISLTS